MKLRVAIKILRRRRTRDQFAAWKRWCRWRDRYPPEERWPSRMHVWSWL